MQIKNKDIKAINTLLGHLNLPGKVSRVRTRLSKKLDALQQDYDQAVADLLGDYEIETKGDRVEFKTAEDRDKFVTDQEEIGNDEMVIEDEIAGGFAQLHDYLDDYPDVISGEDAEAYDQLIELLAD